VLASKKNGGLGVSSLFALNRALLLKWVLSGKGFDFVSHVKKRVGFNASFRREIRDGVERQQWTDILSILGTLILSPSFDRWICDLNGDGTFRVKDIRAILDDMFLSSASEATSWVKYIPIKINVFNWRARLDRLPTRCNLLNRGVVLESSLCPICGLVPEDAQHIFFRCELAKYVLLRICRWWDIHWGDATSFGDWNSWFSSIQLSSKLKLMLEGVFAVAWWHIWSFRNQLFSMMLLLDVLCCSTTLFRGPLCGVVIDVLVLFLGIIG
nr:RNA-directed DNA polymerase, eukaryota [Tanacetum cinerariifolium]